MDESHKNMSMDMNKEVMMHCKTIMANLLTIVCLIVEPITTLEKPKASPEA